MAERKVVNSPIVKEPDCACKSATTTTTETADIEMSCVSGVAAAFTRCVRKERSFRVLFTLKKRFVSYSYPS